MDDYFNAEDPADYEYETGVPKPSALCKAKSTYADSSPIATWILACCGDSKSSSSFMKRSPRWTKYGCVQVNRLPCIGDAPLPETPRRGRRRPFGSMKGTTGSYEFGG